MKLRTRSVILFVPFFLALAVGTTLLTVGTARVEAGLSLELAARSYATTLAAFLSAELEGSEGSAMSPQTVSRVEDAFRRGEMIALRLATPEDSTLLEFGRGASSLRILGDTTAFTVLEGRPAAVSLRPVRLRDGATVATVLTAVDATDRAVVPLQALRLMVVAGTLMTLLAFLFSLMAGAHLAGEVAELEGKIDSGPVTLPTGQGRRWATRELGEVARTLATVEAVFEDALGRLAAQAPEGAVDHAQDAVVRDLDHGAMVAARRSEHAGPGVFAGAVGSAVRGAAWVGRMDGPGTDEPWLAALGADRLLRAGLEQGRPPEDVGAHVVRALAPEALQVAWWDEKSGPRAVGLAGPGCPCSTPEGFLILHDGGSVHDPEIRFWLSLLPHVDPRKVADTLLPLLSGVGVSVISLVGGRRS